MGKPRLSSKLGITAPRIERKVIEKNRRQHMKILYSSLVSLLPDGTSKVEGLPLPDQIDEAVEYIKILKKKLEKMKQKKESLMLARNRSKYSYCSSTIPENNQATNQKRSPLVEIHEMGPNFGLILANGLQDYSKFCDIIRLLYQHGVEVVCASFSAEGTSTIQVFQDKVQPARSCNGRPGAFTVAQTTEKDGKSKMGYGGEAILTRKLKELVCGSSSSEVVEPQLDLCDYVIESDIWRFLYPEEIQYCDEHFYI